MNIFGRSQEQQSFDTKTIGVTATPPLTRIIQNAYIATTLWDFIGTDIAFSNVEQSGTGSKTIAPLNIGDMIVVKLRGMLEVQTGSGLSRFQLWFPYTDGTITDNSYYTEYDDYAAVAAYTDGFIDCEWRITRRSANNVYLSWNIQSPEATDFKSFKYQKVIGAQANVVALNYTEGGSITIDVLYSCNTSSHKIYFFPNHFSIDVIRSVALTADYI